MAAGAECHGSVFERNVMFDTPDERLLKEDKLLRIRKSNGCIVTYKGPRDHDHEFKKRTEVNFDVKSPEMMEAMFRGLGYLPKHMYEKKRETWELSGTEVVIDEVPVMGFFIEIEGSTEGIRKAIPTLGLQDLEKIKKMYYELWLDYQKEHGMEINHNMVFE